MSSGAVPATERIQVQNDDPSQVVESVNDNEIATANDAITSFNDELQQKAGLVGADVENVEQVDPVEAESVSEAQAEVDRLRTDADDRQAAIFDRVVAVINQGGIADVDPEEVQSPADARDVADDLEAQGGLAETAAQSLRDAADIVETDIQPNLNSAADQLEALEEPEPAVGTVEGTVTDTDGEPVANATVAVGDEQTTTADDGSYALELESGEYTLEITADGYEDASENVSVEADSTATVDVALEATDDDGDEGDEDDSDEGSDEVATTVESVNENEVATANDAIGSFNDELQQKAGLVGADVENVEQVDPVEAESVSEAQAEADRLRAGADDRQAAIFDRVVAVINQGGIADVDPEEVQSPADARDVADDLEEQGGLAETAAQSLRDAADIVETDIQPNLNGAADQLEALEDDEPTPTVGTLEGTVTDEDGEPIANATVTVGDEQTTTADDGSYALELESGEYELSVSAEGYEDASENVTIETNSTTTVDLTLEADDSEKGSEVAETVESVNENEVATANDAIGSFNDELQQKAGLVGADVENVSEVDPVDAETVSEAQAEADRLRADADDRQAAIFDRVVAVINQGDIADVDPEEVQSPADARDVADDLEAQGGLAETAAQSLRDAADIVETDIQPNLNGAADQLEALEDDEQTPTVGTLEGTVTDTDGEPVANATVAVGDEQTTTADDGSYALELESGEYELTVSAEGYEDATENVTVEENSTVTVDVSLVRSDDTDSAVGTVEGTVTDEDGEPIAGATVSIDDKQTTTDDDGFYEFEIRPTVGTVDGTVTNAAGEPVGDVPITVGDKQTTSADDGSYVLEQGLDEYTLEVSSEGYGDTSETVTVVSGETTILDITVDEEDVEPSVGTVAGTITDAAGEPIVNATVTAEGLETTTADDGSYELELEPGNHTVTISAEGYQNVSEVVTVEADETNTVDVTLEKLEPTVGTLAGTVTDADGEAIANATVTVGDEQTTTADDGSYALELEEGDYTLEITADGYENATANVTVEADSTVTVDISLEDDSDEGSGSVAEVVESVNNNEIAAANDAIGSFNDQLQQKAGLVGADVENVEQVDPVDAQTVSEAQAEADRLRADADDRQAAIFDRVVAVINQGGIADVDPEEVQSPADARDVADDLEAQGGLAETAAQSLRDAADLVENDIQPDLNGAADQLEALEDDEPTPTVGTLEGTVTDEDGEPIANATVTVGDEQTTTDDNGSYVIDLEEGEYTLEITAGGYENATANVTVEADSTATVDVSLEDESDEGSEVAETVESVNENEIATANDAIGSFNDKLQQKAGLVGADVENVEQVDPVEAETVSEAQAEADRLRTDADDRQAAIFDRVVAVINQGGIADVDPEEVQSPADARDVADDLEAQGGLAETAAQSLRDAADLVENDIQPNLNGAADQLEALEDDEPTPTVGTLEGTVTDADGESIANATVVVGDEQTTTADDGSYALELESGEYALTVSAEGYEDASENVTVEADSTVTVDVSLEEDDGSEPAPSVGTVNGTVTDTDGEAIANAIVTVGGEQTTTADDGSYALELESGEYALTVSAEGYENATANVTVEADSTVTVDVSLEDESDEGSEVAETVESVNENEIATANDAIGSFNDELQQKAGLVGADVENVEQVDPVEAETVSEATEEADRLRADADDREAAIFDRVVAVINQGGIADIDPEEVQSPADARDVADDLEAQGGLAETAAQSLRDAADIVENDIQPNLNSAADQLEALEDDDPTPTVGTIEGTVSDTDSEPIANATVTVGDEQTTTDDNGSYAIDLEEGEYTLEVSADEYESTSETVTVDADGTTTVDVSLEGDDGGSDPAPSVGTVTGTVTDEDGEPIADATISADDETVTTADDGSYELELEDGEYTLEITADGYEDASETVSVDADTTVTVDVTLTETDDESDVDVIVDADIDEDSAAVGETVTVDTDIESATDNTTKISAHTLVVRYDSDALELEDIDRPHWQVIDIENEGLLIIAPNWAPPRQDDTPVDAFTAEFEVVDGAGDDATFEFESDASGVQSVIVEDDGYLWRTEMLDVEYDGASVTIEDGEETDAAELIADAGSAAQSGLAP
ncbi:carboxypeptidase regulatory-like domain-containing protein [Natrinema longum]|uniref:Carboxypeptidase regulatory-like domain-containing protein n=2 Tax=Natrinema longum TaxID=370324 RepID=A0A8A2U7G6_9EURY|nr:carboxypeptidase regulatory-like domain-containing protein [Natrinema longum]QSW84759.1 carboxypeptidase regulatory-like domain-containing protein [Natrinema longum]